MKMLKMIARVRMMTYFSRQFEFARGSLEEQLLKSSKSPYSQFISPDISKLSNNPRELTNPLQHSKWEITINITTAVYSFAPKRVLAFCTCTFNIFKAVEAKQLWLQCNVWKLSPVTSAPIKQVTTSVKLRHLKKRKSTNKTLGLKMFNSGWCT